MLEMAGIVWLVKKLRHLVEASANTAIVYFNCATSVVLVPQTSLVTEKLDLRLDTQN